MEPFDGYKRQISTNIKFRLLIFYKLTDKNFSECLPQAGEWTRRYPGNETAKKQEVFFNVK